MPFFITKDDVEKWINKKSIYIRQVFCERLTPINVYIWREKMS